MRMKFSILLATSLMISHAVFAGTITVANNNQVTWQSTQCGTAPTAPASVTSANPRLPAEEMNKRVTDYNVYVQQVQTYMDCVSKEAQSDSTGATTAINGTAQKNIEDMRKSMADLAAPLQAAQAKK